MSILRSSKFLRYFVTFARNTVFTRPTEYDNTLLRNSKLLVNSNFSYASQPLTQNKNIEKSIQKLDQDVRRSGRISKKELEDVFNEIRHTKHATSTQSLMIIRCCGNLVPEENPEVRTKLVNEIWSTFEKLGVPFDISHYNALLRVYLENEHLFSPSEFLADLQTKGIEPNRVTYQRLITSYCQRGDIEGATRILEFMKEKQMPVNEYVFNSLIMGHFQANDVKSAVGILGVMKQANVTPSAETYTTLMCGYAKNGDIAAINEVLSQCEQEDLDISDRDILEVIYTLAINKHTDLVEQLGGKLKKLPGFNQDAKNAILRLVAKGEDEAALKVFRMMTPITSSEGETVAIGSFLIRQMVKCHRPLEKIIEFCNDLKKSGYNTSAILIATEASLTHGKPELSLKLLTELSKEHEVCHHYYWPVLVQFGKNKNFKGITDTLSQMIQEIGQPVSGETLRDYVAPYIPQNEEGVVLLGKGGIPIATSAAAMIGHLLTKNDIRTAAKIGLQFRANYTSPMLCRSVVLSFISTSDLQSFISLVRIIVDSSKDEDNDIAGKMLLDLVQLSRKNRSQSLSAVLKAYLDSGLGISPQVAEEVQNMLNGTELTSEIEELLSKLISSELTPLELSRPAQIKMVSTENELIRLIKAATARGEPAWNLKRQLLTYYCSNKDLEKAEQYKKELENEGFEFLIGLHVMMMDLYIHHEKLQEALEYYNKTIQNEEIEIDASKVIKLAAFMVKNNMIQEAIDLISKRKVLDADHPTDKSSQYNMSAWRLLNTLAESKDAENLRKMFDLLLEKNFISPNNMLLGPLIKVHLLRNDLDSALNVFEECCMKYRATPWKNEIACGLIQKEDPVSLQKLTDLSTQIHGEINSLYDLVLSFVECGRIRQARKILETPGLRSRTQRLNSASERYDSEGHVIHLENLVEVTKDLHHIDRGDIYYHLLSSYCKADEVDKALGLWTQMQDEDVQPNDAFLVKLGNLLKKHNRPVPFTVPSMKVPEQQKETGRKSQPSVKLNIKSYRSAVNSKDVDEALRCLEKVKDEELSNADRSKLINLLCINGRLGEATKMLLGWLGKDLKVTVRTLSNLINQLALVGDIDTLNILGNKLDLEVKKMTSFTNRIAHCMTEAGRAEEFLANMESKIRAASSPEEIKTLQEEFPRGGIFSILDSPDLLSKFEEIASLYKEKGILEPTNVLWSHYVITRNSEKAAEAWSELKPLGKLLFQPILKYARRAGDLPMVMDVVEKYKTRNLPLQGLGLIYSTAMDISLQSRNIEESEKLLEKGIEDCTIDNISRTTLLRMKKLFEINEKEFKYTIPAKLSRSNVSSSSSDSDSDGERDVKKAAN
ncbi:leucine-rich PPR motif-containing protein, mitochondrial [Halyomorpha halys]|uniref:leucine-rich PPR motif-containing protein, mitochondrial n=1 Tax=Halyomorpha halys TaxID=286706 RepID=UPI0006D500E4|nr:leucine-rich PPR motif-containing protein, mitochondrial [Halyomorpha halys]